MPFDPADSFFVEVWVWYSLNRLPDPPVWGRDNWSVRIGSDPPDPSVLADADLGPEAPHPTLLASPGSSEPVLMNYEGWLILRLPRWAADQTVHVDYTPSSGSSVLASLLVRRPSPPPKAVAFAAATPAPSFSTQAELPFAVVQSAVADELFARTDSCSNAAFAVTYPDDWYTNTPIGPYAACSWFSPSYFEVTDPAVVPDEVGITLTSFVGAIGYVHSPIYTLHERVAVDGYPASRTEEAGGFGTEGLVPTSRRTYRYTVYAGDIDGRKVLGTTANDRADYRLNMAVLDRIMASMVLPAPASEFSPAPYEPADAQFANRRTCTNTEVGYSISYPWDWGTNRKIGDVPACSWFAPMSLPPVRPGVIPVAPHRQGERLEPDRYTASMAASPSPSPSQGGLLGERELENIAITITFDPNGCTAPSMQDSSWREEVIIDGRPATRREELADGTTHGQPARYTFEVGVDGYLPDEDHPGGLLRAVLTGDHSEFDYWVNQAVLDRMMASLTFLDR